VTPLKVFRPVELFEPRTPIGSSSFKRLDSQEVSLVYYLGLYSEMQVGKKNHQKKSSADLTET